MSYLGLSTRALWSLKAAKAPIAPVYTIASRRFIHNSFATFEEIKDENKAAAETTPEAGAETLAEGGEEGESEQVEAVIDQKLPHRRKRFHQWLRADGQRFARPSAAGTNYVGDYSPFPMNPLFKPTPPMSNKAKEEIYKLHRSDSTEWTPRKLGMKFNISIKRVEAILKLKHLEKEMVEEGFVVQENLTKGMEQLMGVKGERFSIFEPLTDILPNVGSPKFEAVDEDQTFTAEDAAKVLKRRPLAAIKASMLKEELQKPFKLVDSVKGIAQHKPAPTTPISRNTAESSARFKFAIMDTSSKTTLIREKDGTLVKVQKSL
ncbi:hypothetical protein BGZ76_001541 [Entomortierella beljakovae]|nr:hypothetical protein BGZ76_001541 [Entomortierella beljakovae]